MKSFITTTLMSIGLASTAHAGLPFETGESLHYDLKWKAFSVGKATLEANGVADMGNQSAYQVSFHVRTNGFADKLYKVRDSYYGFMDNAMSQSYRFDRLEKHKGKPRHVTIDIDQNTRTATYIRDEEKKKPIEILHSSYDPVSIIYAVRQYTLTEGISFSLPVTDGKAAGLVKIEVGKKESITTPAGTFDAVIVEPDLSGFKREGEKDPVMKVWFSADEKQLPLKIESDSQLGRFTAILADTGTSAREPVSIAEIAAAAKN